MRKSRIFLLRQYFLPLGLLCVALSMSGCSEDPTADTVSSGRTIRFEVSETDGWHNVPQSRVAADAAQDSAPQPSGVLTLQGDTPADTLFLHASVCEGIDGTRFVRPESETRAAPVTDEAFYDSFGVLASVFDGEWDEASCTPQYMYDVQVTESSGWKTSYHWPGDGRKLRFFAYAPYNGSGISLSDKTVAGTPKITYTVPEKVEDQKDLCVAVTDDLNGDDNSAAPLTFGHALTAVKFTTGDKMLAGKITQITLKGVYGKATLAMGSTNWTEHDAAAKDFSQQIDVEVNGSPGQAITSDVATFMMLPQTLPEGAQIEIVYTDNQTSTERTRTASIAGTSWPMGRTVNYKISTTSIDITSVLTVTPPSFTYEGGSADYTVTSYATVSSNGTTQPRPLGWTAEFVEGDEESGYTVISKPDWLPTFTTSDNDGSTSAKTYPASALPQEGVSDNPHIEALRKAAEKGSADSPYNLSNAAGAQEVERTANCYVINAPGTYSLPLVYGNAIDKAKNPESPYYNENAYTSSASSSNMLKPFINHAGQGISNPYIYNNTNCTPASVKLIWQDAKGLVSDIKLSDDNHSLVFTVARETIAQGNAVVAVYDASGQVLWSWHIWVTDYKLGDDLKTVSYSGTHTMLPYNLGWCDGDGQTTTYAPRSVKVRFTQKETGEQQVVTVTQKEGSVSVSGSVSGNSPFYQWGRKDPILPSTGKSDYTTAPNKTWYDASGTASTNLTTASWGTGNTTIVNGILNPATFCSNYYMDRIYYNLWAVDNISTSLDLTTSTKTVYDPCPVGYKVPLNNAFRTFTTTGGNTSTASQINGTWNAAEKGWDFNCTGSTVFFPASGYRSYSSGSLYNVGSNGYFWSAMPGSTSYSRYLVFSSSYVNPLNFDERAYGFPVRPVRE